MKRIAFTLVELLVVVAIIAMLASILMPGLSRARELARATNCCVQLKQIGTAFHAEGRTYEGRPYLTRYPPSSLWPAIPLNVGISKEIFLCPDEMQAFADVDSLQFRSQEGWCVDFKAGPYCLVTEGSGYTDYAFEDLLEGDFDMDDVLVRIYQGTPERLVIIKQGTAGYTGNTICYRGEPIILDSSHSEGAEFLLTGGITNYGINARVDRAEVRPNTVVLLDYDQQAANCGEDMTVHLDASARHLGKINVLMANESVRQLGPSRLDPAVSDAAGELWTP